MAFIDRVVGPDEKLIGIVSVHWIYALKGGLWFLGLFLLGHYGASLMAQVVANFPSFQGAEPLMVLGDSFFWICTGIGAILFLFYVIMYMTTELGLTTQRVIYKRGWFMVDTKESDLEEIKAADVDNGIWGRFLNYGYIRFDARFVENVTLPAINDPYRFVKALNEMRTRLKNDTMRPIIAHQVPPEQEAAQHQQGAQAPAKPQTADGFQPAGPVPQEPPTRPEDIPPEYLPPHIQDERYASLERNPVDALENTMRDAPPSASEQRAAQENLRRQHERAPEVAEPIHPHEYVAEDYVPADSPNESGFRTSRTILFKRNVASRKRELSRRLKGAFSRRSRTV